MQFSLFLIPYCDDPEGHRFDRVAAIGTAGLVEEVALLWEYYRQLPELEILLTTVLTSRKQVIWQARAMASGTTGLSVY